MAVIATVRVVLPQATPPARPCCMPYKNIRVRAFGTLWTFAESVRSCEGNKTFDELQDDGPDPLLKPHGIYTTPTGWQLARLQVAQLPPLVLERRTCLSQLRLRGLALLRGQPRSLGSTHCHLAGLSDLHR